MYPYPNPNLITKSLSLIKNIKWGELLDGTQKTLNVINQAIPIFYQVKPLVGNAKTLIKIASGIKESTPIETKKEEEPQSKNLPIFYVE